MKLRVFTDGACSSNPGPGGWAALVAKKNKHKVIGGGESKTTNNRMELLAVIEGIKFALRVLKKDDEYDEIEVSSDSAYVVNAVNMKWIALWKKNGWKTSSKDNVKNRDLWEILDEQLSGEVKISFVKVKGHSGNTFNEMCDQRAREEIKKII